MDKSFWAKLKKPIMALAPMANVTDAAFRRQFVECGKPDIFWTEFVSIDGLLSKGKEKLLVDFWFSKDEHPIVAQIFGSDPKKFEEVAGMVAELGFDGVDINMGCPDRAVEKQGAGASLIKNPELAKEIIRSTKKGARGLPVSVKTRIGYKKNEIEEWIPQLLGEELAALSVHLRTREEMSDVAAHWELAPKIIELRNKYSPNTLILANGDINSLTEAQTKVKETGIDGVMIGRGIFGNPWFFSDHKPDISEKLERMVRHTELFEELYLGEKRFKNFDVMKKHYKAYISGFDGAKELRVRLMGAHNSAEVKKLVNDFLASLKVSGV